MKAKEFLGHNMKIAEDQPEYETLPAFVAPDGTIVVCFQASEEERKKIAETGEVWLQIATFNEPLQPIYMSAHREEVFLYTEEIDFSDIKRMIEQQNPTAKAVKQTAEVRIYQATISNGLLLGFQVPFANMKPEAFNIEMPAADLLPWLIHSGKGKPEEGKIIPLKDPRKIFCKAPEGEHDFLANLQDYTSSPADNVVMAVSYEAGILEILLLRIPMEDFKIYFKGEEMEIVKR